VSTPGAKPAAQSGPAGDEHRLVLDGVELIYRSKGADVHALGPVDLDIAPGEFVALVGPSGCGKSTLLGLIAGFHRPTKGSVSVSGEEITSPSPSRGVVFQQLNLYPWMSVRDNVALGPRLQGMGKAERRELADRQLALVGLAEFADRAPYELSGGMQQRCQIARVLANDPEIMLLDEPFGALDALTRERMQGELYRIWEGSGKTALFITHGVDEAVYLGTRVIVMSPRPGRVVFDERPPWVGKERTPELRASREFVEFREHVRAQIG
jgi:NitT/TauT family transport system ATP-binding protein/taurine transport system ATP-binding protein